MAKFATPEDEWHAFLSGTHPHFALAEKSPLRLIPSSPRCLLCKAPFRGVGHLILKRYGFAPWEKQPKICGRCFKGLQGQAEMCPGAPEGQEIRGGEAEISMLFADVRGSSKIARQMPTMDFTRLMNRFYRESSRVLIEGDAIIEKFVGDEIVGLFVPFMAGPHHATCAVETAQELLRVTGHDSADGPWVPLGAGVHTGTAFVGVVGSDNTSDFTALGDPVNIAAHLASQAAIGEVLVTDQAADAAGIGKGSLEHRHLSLKGHPVDALVLSASAPTPTGG
jgi:adenylate cyclase